MKFTPAKSLILGLFLTGSILSCKVKTDPTPSTNDTSNEAINAWIYDNMKYWYLWTDNMPAKTTSNVSPDDYFYPLLNDYPNTDRFSWIQKDVEELTNSLNGINKVFGMKYTIYYLDNAKTNVGFFITYIIKGSPAEKAGLKRGDIILTINGTQLTATNYSSLTTAENASFGLGKAESGVFSLNGTIIQVTKAEVQDNPVHFWKVIEKGNKKIGYLVYSQFISTFDSNLRQVFGEFKSKGVNELVLDLRLNPGGYISSADIMASLIVKNLNTDNVIHSDQWNANITKDRPSYSTPTKFRNEANNLGTLTRLYVLTSNGTASASELVINGLRPYMDVILIGSHTYGKNVGSVTLSDSEKRWKWAMQPIVLKTINSKGESNYGTKSGFAPDYEVVDNVVPFKDWGDENETLLKKALELITGQVATQQIAPNARVSITEMKGDPLKVNESENPYQNRKEMYVTFPK
ncbi:S41 family peptidase [Emticicia sp. BO119]|uniref:S41 family peptidase n=1 Tax=Emticicia sp. BO119 TaxID=2757768 RepID=UPI0015F089CC|nr:S41 family peptidase [Emticicia sp. BO119]MBA4853036.1 PDZ domain-containing protein [Emticicia sp. BO119]